MQRCKCIRQASQHMCVCIPHIFSRYYFVLKHIFSQAFASAHLCVTKTSAKQQYIFSVYTLCICANMRIYQMYAKPYTYTYIHKYNYTYIKCAHCRWKDYLYLYSCIRFAIYFEGMVGWCGIWLHIRVATLNILYMFLTWLYTELYMIHSIDDLIISSITFRPQTNIMRSKSFKLLFINFVYLKKCEYICVFLYICNVLNAGHISNICIYCINVERIFDK